HSPASPTFPLTPSAANPPPQPSTLFPYTTLFRSTYESFKLTSFAITPPPPATITSVTADKSAPQPPGTTVTFTATATGGKPPYQFKWWVFDGTMWMVAQRSEERRVGTEGRGGAKPAPQRATRQ